jgi:hypothetical protein
LLLKPLGDASEVLTQDPSGRAVFGKEKVEARRVWIEAVS